MLWQPYTVMDKHSVCPRIADLPASQSWFSREISAKRVSVPHSQARWTVPGLVSHGEFAGWIECFQISRAEDVGKVRGRDGIKEQSCKELRRRRLLAGAQSHPQLCPQVWCTWQTPQGKGIQHKTRDGQEWGQAGGRVWSGRCFCDCHFQPERLVRNDNM